MKCEVRGHEIFMDGYVVATLNNRYSVNTERFERAIDGRELSEPEGVRQSLSLMGEVQRAIYEVYSAAEDLFSLSERFNK